MRVADCAGVEDSCRLLLDSVGAWVSREKIFQGRNWLISIPLSLDKLK